MLLFLLIFGAWFSFVAGQQLSRRTPMSYFVGIGAALIAALIFVLCVIMATAENGLLGN